MQSNKTQWYVFLIDFFLCTFCLSSRSSMTSSHIIFEEGICYYVDVRKCFCTIYPCAPSVTSQAFSTKYQLLRSLLYHNFKTSLPIYLLNMCQCDTDVGFWHSESTLTILNVSYNSLCIQILYITQPEMWSAAAMYQATRIFASNLNVKMAQR